MKIRLNVCLCALSLVLIVCCNKSKNLTAREQLLTGGSWKLQRIDTFMYHADTVIKLGSLVDSCYNGTVLTFDPSGDATYKYICRHPSPVTYSGDWSLAYDSVLKTHSENDPERYYDTVRVITNDVLVLQSSYWHLLTPTYPYPYQLLRIYSH